MCQISCLMAAVEGPVAEFSGFANFELTKRKSNLLMSFPKIVNQMGSFGEKRKKNFFPLLSADSRYFRISALKLSLRVQHSGMSISQCSNLLSVHHVASSRRHNFATGQTNFVVFVFTSAVRTHKSSPGNTLVTRPNNQRLLGTVLSTTRTRSFTAKFHLFRNHLGRCCNVGI